MTAIVHLANLSDSGRQPPVIRINKKQISLPDSTDPMQTSIQVVTKTKPTHFPTADHLGIRSPIQQLPKISDEKIHQAITVREKIKTTFRDLNRTYIEHKHRPVKTLKQDLERQLQEHDAEQYKTKLLQTVISIKEGETELPDLNLDRTTWKKFSNLVALTEPELANNEEMLALVAYYSVRNNKDNPDGLFTSLPVETFVSKENLTPQTSVRIGTLAKLAIVNLEGKNTPKDVEDIDNWVSLWKKYNLSNLRHLYTIPETLDMAFPKCLEGNNPLIRPWKIQSTAVRKGSKKEEIVIRIVKHIAEYKLKIAAPITADKIRAIPDWTRQINLESDGCLKRSGVKTAYEALKLTYPHLFGWGKDQIKPWEIRRDDLWTGPKGKQLFKLAFAYSLWTSGLGKFNPHETQPLKFTEQEFLTWKHKNLGPGKGWIDHFVANKLTAGYDTASGSNIVKAFEILVGKKDESTQCFGETKITVNNVTEKNSVLTPLTIRFLNDYGEINSVTKICFVESEKSTESTPLGAVFTAASLKGKRRTLYLTTLAAVVPQTSNAQTGLEKILLTKRKGGTSSEKNYVLDEANLCKLIRFIRDDIVDHTNLKPQIKTQLKDLLTDLNNYGQKKRESLSEIIQTNPKYYTENNSLNDLNDIVELLIESVIIYELQNIQATAAINESGEGEPTDFYKEASASVGFPYNQQEIEGVDLNEEEFDTNI